jgi:hypothetical protein
MSSSNSSFTQQSLLVLLILVTSSFAQSARTSQDAVALENGRNQFVGGWRLVSLEEADVDGKVHKADCTGMFVFSADGKASVQVMYRNPKTDSNGYTQDGYEASFGRYEINDAHTFTFHVEGALVRTLVGKDLKREYEFTGKQLTVKSSNPNEHWRVTWERD